MNSAEERFLVYSENPDRAQGAHTSHANLPLKDGHLSKELPLAEYSQAHLCAVFIRHHLDLSLSGEFAYTLGKIAELGMVEQSKLHSRTNQYGSMSRGTRFVLPEMWAKMQEGLEEIRSGKFAQEWAAEQEVGCPTLETLREAARSLPLYQLEQELGQALR